MFDDLGAVEVPDDGTEPSNGPDVVGSGVGVVYSEPMVTVESGVVVVG